MEKEETVHEKYLKTVSTFLKIRMEYCGSVRKVVSLQKLSGTQADEACFIVFGSHYFAVNITTNNIQTFIDYGKYTGI